MGLLLKVLSTSTHNTLMVRQITSINASQRLARTFNFVMKTRRMTSQLKLSILITPQYLTSWSCAAYLETPSTFTTLQARHKLILLRFTLNNVAESTLKPRNFQQLSNNNARRLSQMELTQKLCQKPNGNGLIQTATQLSRVVIYQDSKILHNNLLNLRQKRISTKTAIQKLSQRMWIALKHGHFYPTARSWVNTLASVK